MSGDPSDVTWQQKRALIIGRASPEPSKTHLETVCTGGITEDGEVLRLYPIPLRYLQAGSQYKLWTWAKFDVQKNPSDKRKESYKVRDGSIEILGEITDKAERFSFLEKAIFRDRETLDLRYREDWTSIGIVEIEFVKFYAQAVSKDWRKDKPYMRQALLYTERKPLEQLPFQMRLKFRCKNNPECKTHESALIGWEYMEAFRQFRTRYPSPEAAFDAIRNKLSSLFGDQRKRAFALLGTHFKYPAWMVAQLYFFDKNLERSLF
jgi:hypothetical protein